MEVNMLWNKRFERFQIIEYKHQGTIQLLLGNSEIHMFIKHYILSPCTVIPTHTVVNIYQTL